MQSTKTEMLKKKRRGTSRTSASVVGSGYPAEESASGIGPRLRPHQRDALAAGAVSSSRITSRPGRGANRAGAASRRP